MNSYEKPDAWSIKARKEGYPARSVYKLSEIAGKFKLLRPGMRILDVGAAPGSWSLWLLRALKESGFIAAVDLSPLAINAPAGNFFFIQGDFYDEAVRKALSDRGPFDLVLSDAAPSTTGNSTVDTCRSEALVEAVVDYAAHFLKPGGSMVAKLFMGGGERAILDTMRTLFESARGFKPKACRAESFETYLIGLNRK